MLSPGQTIAACQRNMSQYCWAQHVACTWPACCDLLRHVGCCWLKFETGQSWANITQQVTTCRNRPAPAKRTQHVTLACCDRLAGSLGHWFGRRLIIINCSLISTWWLNSNSLQLNFSTKCFGVVAYRYWTTTTTTILLLFIQKNMRLPRK